MKTTSYLSLIIVLFVSHTEVQAQLPTGFTNIDINNVDAGITSSNDLFWDFSSSKYEVPKGSGLHSIFSGGMWIGGIDNGGQLHMATQTYRQVGNDFFPGPIDTINSVPTNWNLWDTSWKLNKTEVLDHIQNYNIPGYVVPASIADWPGYNATLGRVLAPFADFNSNGIYDPENGDYPYIYGDQTVYSIFNDLNIHTESGCLMLGIEVHRTMFAFDAPTNQALNNTIFARYEIKNFGSIPYNNVNIAMWIDFEIGNAFDDYVGTDMNLDMIYGYNGDNNDEGPYGYGLNPPAMGVYFLDDSLSGSLVYDNVNGVPNGNPASCNDFMNYINTIWLNNQPITYGGSGNDPGNPPTNHMYTGTTNPVYYPAFGDWSEGSVPNPSGDRRMIGILGPFTLAAGGYKSFDVGFTWSRATSGGALASVIKLQDDVTNLRMLYDSGALTSLPTIAGNDINLVIYPNPASDHVTIQNPYEGKRFTVKIQDALGRIVYEKGEISGKLIKTDISGLEKGLYMVEVSQGSARWFSKIIKK